MEEQQISRLGTVKPSRDRWQGMITGAGITLILVVLVTVGLLFIPQKHTVAHETGTQIGQAGFEVSMNRKQLNGVVDQYLNSDKRLNKHLRFEMTNKNMLVLGTYRLLGQNVDFGMKMTPEVTAKGNVLLHANSVAVGKLPLPVKYVMSYVKGAVDLPDWVTIDVHDETILIDLSKVPEVQGMHFKAKTIDPAKGRFVFEGGFEN